MDVLKKKLTYAEFREMEFEENDNFWYELINGKLVQKQAPTAEHQAIAVEIEYALVTYAKQKKSGRTLHAPFDVVLDDGNMYHPDIFFIKKDRLFIIDEREKVVMGAPDLVIEILSKSTAGDDKGDKKDNYEKYGVREYWLVDPKKKSFEVYTLVNERYKLTAYLEETGILKSTVLKGFELDIGKVFEEAKLD